jgi:hypothetical protein
MDSNLVGAAGFQPCRDEAGPPVKPQNLEVCDSRLSLWVHLHLESVKGISPDGSIHTEAFLLKFTPNNGQVSAFSLLCSNLLLEISVGPICLGGHHQAGGVFVEAMDNAWPKVSTF